MSEDKEKEIEQEVISVEQEPQDQPADADRLEKGDEGVEKTPPGRFKIFLRKALIWLGVVLVAFLAGFLTDHFTLYRPMNQERLAIQEELEKAEQTLNELETENTRLVNELDSLRSEKDVLQQDLAQATANLQYYQVLVDVNNARIQLFMEDIEGAQESLAGTQALLEELLPWIEAVDADLALSLPRRLDLIVSGLVRDPDTGMIDLELFTKDLLELEPLLFEQ